MYGFTFYFLRASLPVLATARDFVQITTQADPRRRRPARPLAGRPEWNVRITANGGATVTASATVKATYRVIDAYDHPHGGRILRLRLGRGEALGVKELQSGARWPRLSPEGEEARFEVLGFALFGGRVSDARLARTGRVDIRVRGEDARGVRPGWTVAGPRLTPSGRPGRAPPFSRFSLLPGIPAVPAGCVRRSCGTQAT